MLICFYFIQIGQELSEEDIKLLNSEGVETTKMTMKDCVIL